MNKQGCSLARKGHGNGLKVMAKRKRDMETRKFLQISPSFFIAASQNQSLSLLKYTVGRPTWLHALN